MSDHRKFLHLPTSIKLKSLTNVDSNFSRPSRLKSESINEMTPRLVIDDVEIDYSKICDEFIQYLTISKFKEFAENCKKREIENIKHDMRLKKSQFIQVMKTSFLSEDRFTKLYEKIFNRFKLLKAEVNRDHKIENSYFISRIFSEEEIDIYEISCALACFVKCYFSEKLKLLFDLTDIDEDGFISDNEVRKLIYTVNLLFYEEAHPSCTGSTILSNSLASIRAKKSFNMIMKHPGNLSEIIQEEKYVHFSQFQSAVEKVYQYKFDLMPMFISLKHAINTKRGEKEFDIKYETFHDYGKISNDIVSELKKEGEYGTSIYDFKKNLELMKKASKIKPIYTSANNKKRKVKKINKLKKDKFNILPKYFIKFAQKDIYHDIYHINYNKIGGLETYPGKFNILITDNKPIRNSRKKLNNLYNTNTNIQSENRKTVNPGYMTNKEIFDEIIALSNKHKISDEGTETLLRVGKEVHLVATSVKNKLKETGQPIKLGIDLIKTPTSKKSKKLNKLFKDIEE